MQTIGRYHVLEELGRGAMAVVYKGFDPVIGRSVALKTIAFGTADSEVTDLRQRLYREACAAGTLAHPNIVTIYDVIEQEGVTAVAMELVEGQTLASLIAERAPLPLDTALGIFEQIAGALDYASAKGIVHRDIKPANILMTPDGHAKVADFGVARMAISSMTQTGTVVGSPSYMSPEQVRGQHLDGRSDLFSAAVVLFELLTKERPFAGDDVATTMYRIVHEPPTPASEFNSAVGPQISEVFDRALAKDPDRRYRSGTLQRAAPSGRCERSGLRGRVGDGCGPGAGTKASHRDVGGARRAADRASAGARGPRKTGAGCEAAGRRDLAGGCEHGTGTRRSNGKRPL